MQRVAWLLIGVGAWLVLTLCVQGCGADGGRYQPTERPAQDDVVSLAARDWSVKYSAGSVGEHPREITGGVGAWYVDLPRAPETVNYVQVAYRATRRPTQVTLTYRLECVSDNVTAQQCEYYQAGLQDVNPATVNLFLERRGDDLTDVKKFYYRWWPRDVTPDVLPRVSGATQVTITLALTWDKWVPVEGATDQAQFEATLADLGAVGVTFGGQWFRGHGVGVVGSGKVRFVLVEFKIS